MSRNTTLGRDVHFFDSSRPDKALGGLKSTSSFTERTFLSALEILIISNSPYDIPLRPTDEPLQPGLYDIKPLSPDGRILITKEWCITRVPSYTVSGRDEKCRPRVRERDGKCVITGAVNPRKHTICIFPLSGELWFSANGFSRWITNREDEHDTGTNSCQNGLLMRSHVHEEFDNFSFSINVDDDYKVVTFMEDVLDIGGRLLDPLSASDKLLRWHFRQAVLANMRGAGEPIFETDFPHGSDMVGEIMSGPEAAKRMEAELFSRLNGMSLA
ncbi:hypothetical protein V1508DRAFT_403995 [Lipomyces doorenjongii]|uniref:uncharacterized protein n=1 Tax=Lipomyces doorenjongii TaxID=383834 RepID=UPI0034D0173E